MFESVDGLMKRLPTPEWTGTSIADQSVVEQHLANARRLRNEAVLCIARALISGVSRGIQRFASWLGGAPSHQV